MRIEDADLVVGVFWKRFGTPTHESQSGTEHELRRAWAAWQEQGHPQVMVYFNVAPYAPESGSELDQWKRVLDFRDAMPEQQLWWRYPDAGAFEKLARQHLTAWILDDANTGQRPPLLAPVPAAALRRVRFGLPPRSPHFTGRDAELERSRSRSASLIAS